MKTDMTKKIKNHRHENSPGRFMIHFQPYQPVQSELPIDSYLPRIALGTGTGLAGWMVVPLIHD